MAGAAVPAVGVVSDSGNTKAEQKDLFEDITEALRRSPVVGVASASAVVISSGTIVPTLGFIAVDTEGATSTDNLDHIDPSAFLPNSIIMLISSSGGSRLVTVRHNQGGTGAILLRNSANFDLANTYAWLSLRLDSTGVWLEVDRGYGPTMASFRAFIGLGSVATLANGAVDAATLQGHAATYFLAAAGTAANSTLFAGLATAAFLRADIASLQQIAGSLRANSGRLESDAASSAGAPALALRAGGVERTHLFYDGTSGQAMLRLLDASAAVVAGLRFRSGLIPDYWDGAAWVPLFELPTPSPWLDAVRWDKLGSTTNYGTTGNFILHSADTPSKPGSGSTRIFRVSAAITGQKGSGGNAPFTARIYVGNAGDDTDTLIDESASVTAATIGVPVTATLSDEYEVPAGSKITLVLAKSNSQFLDVLPSVAGTYKIDTKRTYLRVEQIG